MALYYPFLLVEREVFGLINALKSNDVADAEANIALVGQIGVAHVDDAAYPPFLVRRVILTVHNLIASAIINTVGHARRVDFKQTFQVAHGGNLPTALGPIGAVYEEDSGLAYIQRTVDEINQLRANPIALPASVPTPKFLFFALDGNKFFSANGDEQATVEHYAFTGPGNALANVNALFANENAKTNISDEFIPALVYGSVTVVAGKAGGNTEQAAMYGRLFDMVMTQQGIPRKIKLDYKDDPGRDA